MTDVSLGDDIEKRFVAGTPERCKSAIEQVGENTLADIRSQSLPERSVPELQKLHAALDELYLHALSTDKAQLRMFCLFLYLDVRKRYLQVGLSG